MVSFGRIFHSSCTYAAQVAYLYLTGPEPDTGSSPPTLLGRPKRADASDRPVLLLFARPVWASPKVNLWNVFSCMRLVSINQKPVLRLWLPLIQTIFGVMLQFGFSLGACPRTPKSLLPPATHSLVVSLTRMPANLSMSLKPSCVSGASPSGCWFCWP